MTNLKTLRTRIRSVRETQKITTAMMLVSGSKLRKAEQEFHQTSPYLEGISRLFQELQTLQERDTLGVKFLEKEKKEGHHLIIVMSSDRGLCGSFNAAITREVKKYLKCLEEEGKTFSILPIGRKGIDLLKGAWSSSFLDPQEFLKGEEGAVSMAVLLKDYLVDLYDRKVFDVCMVFYSKFYSVMSQVPQREVLVPICLPLQSTENLKGSSESSFFYEVEPKISEFLSQFLESYISSRLLYGILQTKLSEQGARMMAMDGATRNAKEMIKSLSLLYNRSRQAMITKELIEIISGSEAL